MLLFYFMLLLACWELHLIMTDLEGSLILPANVGKGKIQLDEFITYR